MHVDVARVEVALGGGHGVHYEESSRGEIEVRGAKVSASFAE